MPNDCFQVDRVEYEEEYLAVLSREDRDVRYLPKGLHIIKSDINMGTLEISEPFNELDNYAIFIDGSEINIIILDLYGVAAHSTNTIFESSLGVVTKVELLLEDIDTAHYGSVVGAIGLDNIDYTVNPYGVISTGEQPEHVFGFLSSVKFNHTKGTYGICTDVLVHKNYLKVYYSATSPTVNSLYDALVLPDLWMKALVHYVVGMARQDDNDEGNYSLGEAEMKKYNAEVYAAKKLSAKSFNSPVRDVRETIYRRF